MTTIKDVLRNIKAKWDINDFMGPTLNTPLVCCLCIKELSGNCGVSDFREFCPEYNNSSDVFKLEYVTFAGVIEYGI